eukprot:TRINITY_DN20156_c0_g1_i1.p1 TRINITY_DN20156_c0_g1~~TRINITY_DN20156_c0_g1_i1.p1  ORF type:complete len:402 (+),score=61.72 TRINITY_DN20156_c0_g1_i1:50-1255(+)
MFWFIVFFFFFQAEDGIRDHAQSRGLGDVYKRQYQRRVHGYPSVQDLTVTEIKAKVTTSGLLANYTDSSDPYLIVYGYEALVFSTSVYKEFNYMKSDSKYQVKYYCVNQLDLVSDPITSTWLSPSNGGFLLKITILYDSTMSYYLENQIACKLANLFSIDSTRVITEISTYCNQDPYSNSITTSDSFLKSAVGNLIPYYFYIIPDYFTDYDSTNNDIRDLMSEDDFLTLFDDATPTSTLYPTVESISSEDIVETNTPAFYINSISTDVNSVTISATITNMYGYIVIGVIQGYYTTSPTISLLKQNLYGNGAAELDQQVIRYSSQNIAQTFIFRSLTPGTQYTFFLAASIDDPSINSQGTSVITKYITTEEDVVTLNLGGGILSFQLLQMIGLLLLLFFLLK